MFLRYLVFLFCFCLTNVVAYTQAHNFTLKECVETALANNNTIKEAALTTEISNINFHQAKRDKLPEVSANVAHGINQGRSIDPFTNSYINQAVGYGNYNVGAGILLFNGFQTKNLILQNRLGLQASELEEQAAKDNITLTVILAYLQVLSLEEQLQQAKNQSEVTSKQVERLNILNKEGAIVPALFFDLRGQLANDELASLNIENMLENARLSLLRAMNIPYTNSITVEPITADQLSAYEFTAAEVYKKALSQLASVKAAELRKQTATTAVYVAKGLVYPQVSLNGNLNTNFSSAATQLNFINTIEIASGDFVTVNGNKLPVMTQQSNFNSSKIRYFNQLNNNYNTSLGLNIRIPIFNSTQSKTRIALARAEVKRESLLEENLKTSLRQSIEESWLNMTAAYKKYMLILKQIEDYKQSFHSAEVRFQAGVSTTVDYLLAKNNLERANIQLMTAKYELLLRRKILDFYQGISVF